MPAARSRSAAQIIAAAIPLASHAPRPQRRVPSIRGGIKGGTVSRWVDRVTAGASTLAAKMLLRPPPTGISTSRQPRCPSRWLTCDTIARSSPLVESICISSLASSTGSSTVSAFLSAAPAATSALPVHRPIADQLDHWSNGARLRSDERKVGTRVVVAEERRHDTNDLRTGGRNGRGDPEGGEQSPLHGHIGDRAEHGLE
jgi:hypothetical protein